MANLLPIGNQLVIFILVPLPGTVRLFAAVHQPFGSSPSVVQCGGGKLLSWKQKVGDYFTIYVQFLNNDFSDEVNRVMTQLGKSETMRPAGVHALCNGNYSISGCEVCFSEMTCS